MNKLTELKLKALIKKGEPINGLSDGGGLTFTISKAGTAAWLLRYTQDSKKKELTLGKYLLSVWKMRVKWPTKSVHA